MGSRGPKVGGSALSPAGAPQGSQAGAAVRICELGAAIGPRCGPVAANEAKRSAPARNATRYRSLLRFDHFDPSRRCPPIKRPLRVNEKIRAKEVRLIDAKGEQLGLLTLEDAQARADRDSLDLVEVAPDSTPPVCKIMDYRRQIFEQKRRQKEARKKTKSQLKEIKLRPKIDPHDYGIKLRRVKEFLEKGHKVKVTMRYRYHEMRHYENGTHVMDRVAEDVSDMAEVDANSRRRESRRSQTMILTRRKH